MGAIVPIEEALADSSALAEAAKEIGITMAQAKRFMGCLAPEQATRIASSARAERVRAANRDARLRGHR